MPAPARHPRLTDQPHARGPRPHSGRQPLNTPSPGGNGSQLFVDWDKGRILILLLGEDAYFILDQAGS